MSTLADDLAPIASLLSAAAGPAGAVTATANFLTAITKIAGPIITDDETQRYANQRKETIQRGLAVLNQPDSPAREQQLADYFSQLLLDAGSPAIGGVGSGPLIGVRVEFLLAVAAGLAGKVYDDQYLTAVLAKVTSTEPSGNTLPK